MVGITIFIASISNPISFFSEAKRKQSNSYDNL